MVMRALPLVRMVMRDLPVMMKIVLDEKLGSLTKMLGDTVYYFSPRASKKVEREPLSARSKDQLMVFEDGSEALTGDWMKDKAAFTAAQRRLEQNIRTRKLKAKANDYDKSRRDTRKSAECISEVCTMHLN